MKYTIKSMTLSEILDQSVNIVKEHLKMLLGITCYILIPVNLAQHVVLLLMMPKIGSNPTQAEAQQFLLAMIPLMIPLIGFAMIMVFVALPITNAAVIRAVASEYLGKPTTAAESMKSAFKSIGALLLTSILAGIMIMLPIFFFIMAIAVLQLGGILLFPLVFVSIYLAFRYWFATSVVMIEERSGSDALKRSGALMTGNYGTAFVLGLIVTMMNGATTSIANMVPVPVITVILQVVIEAVMMVFGAAAGVVFYFSARCKLENFDLTVLAGTVAEGPPPEFAPAPEQ